MNDIEERSVTDRRLSMTQSRKGLASTETIRAELVRNDIVNAVPLEVMRPETRMLPIVK